MAFEIPPQHEFLIGIDSDGCAFDTMELKHKECFIPNIINHYELQGISKYAREAAEFVNLYSKDRGINRFPALIRALELLQQRPEVKARGYVERCKVPPSLAQWVKQETKLGNPALEAKVKATGDEALTLALKWSKAVNETIAGMVRGVPPFPYVRESLEKLAKVADIVVCSATPNEALKAEWHEHGIDQYVVAICGQEIGSKKEILQNAAKYAPGKTLMIGDAPGDYSAAKANRCSFFPINPGHEEASWERFYTEGIEKFLSDQFAGDYQKKLLEEFDKYLPEKPSWKTL
jgi:phosphoglycolate phosphatase-like HAD superfamily hydrolase